MDRVHSLQDTLMLDIVAGFTSEDARLESPIGAAPFGQAINLLSTGNLGDANPATPCRALLDARIPHGLRRTSGGHAALPRSAP
jgi:hypothetical protein